MGAYLAFIKENFTHVGPILAAGAFAIVITIERTKALVWGYPMEGQEAFFERVRALVMADKINEAIAFCERYWKKPVARVVKEGLSRAEQPDSLIEHGLQIAVGEVTQKITARTGFLATIANVATLLGLFGTIMGLIQSFEAVGSANAQQRSALLAAGISTAMNATMMGLAIAIPCMIIFSYLMSRTNRLTAEVDRSAVRILDLLKQRYYSAETAVAEVPAPIAVAPPPVPEAPAAPRRRRGTGA
jgi:biopolymer transport protein ExbB/TolQ